MLQPIADKLIAENWITLEDYYQAEKELNELTDTDFVSQILWVAEAIK